MDTKHKKVFCRYCKFCSCLTVRGIPMGTPKCKENGEKWVVEKETYYSPESVEQENYRKCSEVNKNNDCVLFKRSLIKMFFD